jgi:hypothetical protein
MHNASYIMQDENGFERPHASCSFPLPVEWAGNRREKGKIVEIDRCGFATLRRSVPSCHRAFPME